MRHTFTLALLLIFAAGVNAQVPVATGVQILKAEDARRYDSVLEGLMRSPNADVRKRAALAAGRIGDERALPVLTSLLEKDASADVREMAAFAIGEVESEKGVDAVITGLKREASDAAVRARLVEAAGKMASANPKDPGAKQLGAAILDVLRSNPSDQLTARLALTAALRARPDGGAPVVAKYIDSADGNVRADALNTLARLRSKERLGDIRALLRRDPDPIVRANAARVLGGADDKEAYPLLLDYAVNGDDLRVRVACIRSLASLKDSKAAAPLIAYGRKLLGRSKGINRAEKNELLEIATTVGRLLEKTNDRSGITFLTDLAYALGYRDPETFTALARVSPRTMIDYPAPADAYRVPQAAAAYAQGLATVAETKDNDLIAKAGDRLTGWTFGMGVGVRPTDKAKMLIAMPAITGAMAELKPDNLDDVLRGQLQNDDVFVRAAAAGAIADRPVSSENVAALKSAFTYSFIRDKHDDDALLAVMDALYRLNKKESTASLLMALTAPDYLVRKKAFELLSDPELQKDFPGIPASLETARSKHMDEVLPYSTAFGTRLGQVLNTDVDYRRALSRKNGTVRAILSTDKGAFTIEFTPEEAPLTVDNFVKLARSGYFNGLEVHRVVPNFVMQDGDPRGDGSGGPGWSIRCEVNMLPYDRGAIGMALSGKDTGGSQWFVTHSPQPHLDGGYTVFGHVSEKDMKVVDSIVRGDRIISVKVVESGLPKNSTRTPRAK